MHFGFGRSFPFILAFWAFISFRFSLLGLHFLSFWPFGPSFLWILAFWAFISFHFGLLGFHFLSFFACRGCHVGPPHKLPKTVRFLIKFRQILSAAGPAEFSNFWPFGPSFPFILAFWAFISFHFGLLGLHFLSFWPFGASFPFISFHFGLLGLHFLSFSPFGALFSCILAFWAFFSIHFGLLGLHFLLFWPFGLSFPFILAFWAFISFHFGLLGLHFSRFWPFGLLFPLIFCLPTKGSKPGSAARVLFGFDLQWLSRLWPDVRGVLTVRRVVASLLCSFTTQKENDSPDNLGLHAAPPLHCWPWPQKDHVGFEAWVPQKIPPKS